MSHGHDHKDYKRVFGDVERGSRGLIVLCDGESPKSGTDVRQQVRAVCLGQPMAACKTCEHSTFTLRLKPNVGNEIVACPVWPSIEAKMEHEKPQYQMVRREQCLIRRPYDYCSFCPNMQVNKQAETTPGWWEKKMWKED
jgi:hypothetical protein